MTLEANSHGPALLVLAAALACGVFSVISFLDVHLGWSLLFIVSMLLCLCVARLLSPASSGSIGSELSQR
jgi:membrane protein implicated in regulation of membrane protease activity